MEARDVSRPLGEVYTGKHRGTTSGSWITSTRGPGFERLVDTHGSPYTVNPLRITRERFRPAIGNGRSSSSNLATFMEDYPFLLQVPTFPNVRESNSAYWARFVANTNPSRAEVLLPTFIFEVKDIPRMIRHAGRFLNGTAYRHSSGLSAAKEAASANLATQFGWLPLVSDLHTLANFSDAVNRRKKELDRLYGGSGLKRRMTMHEYSNTFKAVLPISPISSLKYWPECPVTQEVKVWATCKWKPSSKTPLRVAPAHFRRILLGLTPSAVAENVWEALPWSWLIDYFTNIGDVVASTNNSLGAILEGGCLMIHEKRSVYYPGRTGPWGSNGFLHVESGNHLKETKERFPMGAVAISAAFPILSGKQLSILASLALLRTGRSS